MSRADSAANLDGWQRRALELARACEVAGAIAELEAPRPVAVGAAMRVVVLGEDMRGKSTLANRLVGFPVVPIGPTTRAVLIVAADHDSLELIHTDGAIDALPLEPGSWDRVASDASSGYIRASVRSEMLAVLDVELVDTPGLDLAEPASPADPGPSIRAVPDGDVTLVVVSATSPLSMSEQGLLERSLTKGRVPYPAVVLTKLDLVEPEERGGVIGYVTARVRRVSDRLPVIPVLPGADGLGALTAFIGMRRGDPNRGQRRARQRAWQLHDIAVDLGRVVHERAEARRQQATRDTIRATAELAIAGNAQAWNEIVTEMRSRRGKAIKRSREWLDGRAADMATRLCSEAREAADPKAWWLRHFPARLDHELRQAARLEEKELAQAFQTDIGWLTSEVERRFQVRLSPPLVPEGDMEVVSRLRKLDLKDLEIQRVALRIGKFAATIVIGMVLRTWEGSTKPSNPGALRRLGVSAADELRQQKDAVSGLIGNLGERWERRELESQRDAVVTEVQGSVRRSFDDFADRLAERLGEVYRRILDEVRRAEVTLRDDMLSVAHGSTAGVEEQWVAAVDALLAEIATWLAEPVPGDQQ